MLPTDTGANIITVYEGQSRRTNRISISQYSVSKTKEQNPKEIWPFIYCYLVWSDFEVSYRLEGEIIPCTFCEVWVKGLKDDGNETLLYLRGHKEHQDSSHNCKKEFLAKKKYYSQEYRCGSKSRQKWKSSDEVLW